MRNEDEFCGEQRDACQCNVNELQRKGSLHNLLFRLFVFIFVDPAQTSSNVTMQGGSK